MARRIRELGIRDWRSRKGEQENRRLGERKGLFICSDKVFVEGFENVV